MRHISLKELYYHFQQNRVQLEAYNTRKLKRSGWNDLQHCYALQEIKPVKKQKVADFVFLSY